MITSSSKTSWGVVLFAVSSQSALTNPKCLAMLVPASTGISLTSILFLTFTAIIPPSIAMIVRSAYRQRIMWWRPWLPKKKPQHFPPPPLLFVSYAAHVALIWGTIIMVLLSFFITGWCSSQVVVQGPRRAASFPAREAPRTNSIIQYHAGNHHIKCTTETKPTSSAPRNRSIDPSI